MNARQELAREAEAIMLAGGFIEARAEHFGPWWRVYGKLANDNEHTGTTHLQADPQDPREMARTLVAKLAPDEAAPVIEEIPEAPETVEETFAPGEGPFDPAPEAEETPEHETHGEAGEEAAWVHGAGPQGGADAGASRGDSACSDDDAATLVSAVGRSDAHDGAAERSFAPDVSDADFTTDPYALPEIELVEPDADPDFGGELLEFEDEVEAPDLTAPAQDRFIGLDDLDRRRSLRIGDTIRYAKTLLPPWSDEQDAALRELRNFAMGVSEKRWGDDPAKQAELEALERDARRIRQIEAARDAKVEFLEAASRDEIEAFVLEDGWPA